MSAEMDLRALLVGASSITALISTNVSADGIPLATARPFVVYTRTATEYFRTLDGTVYETKVLFELQCWGDTRTSADAVAAACTPVINAGTNGTVIDRSTGYDGDLDLEVTSLVVEWWE